MNDMTPTLLYIDDDETLARLVPHPHVTPPPATARTRYGFYPVYEPDGQQRPPALGGRIRNDAPEQLLGESMAPDRQHGAQRSALRLALSLAPLTAGDVDLESTPAERSPQQGLDQPHGLHAPRADHLGRELAARRLEGQLLVGKAKVHGRSPRRLRVD